MRAAFVFVGGGRIRLKAAVMGKQTKATLGVALQALRETGTRAGIGQSLWSAALRRRFRFRGRDGDQVGGDAGGKQTKATLGVALQTLREMGTRAGIGQSLWSAVLRAAFVFLGGGRIQIGRAHV